MSALKKFRCLMFLAAVMIVGFSAIASAAPYDGAWLANDNDFFAIELTATADSNAGLYLYDFDDGTGDSMLLFTDSLYSSATVYFTEDSGIWYAGLSSGVKTLDLGGSKDIGFYFLKGANPYPSYDVTTVDPGEVYSLFETNTAMTVLVSDIAPVPLPASLFLLGSGILSLVVSRRKSR